MSILSFKSGKKRRFEILIQPHLEPMYRFAFRLAGQQHDAEDLVQDVVVKLYPRLEELETVDQLRPWLNRVLYRHFIDQLRRKGRQGDRPMSDLVEADSQADWLDSLDAEDTGPMALLELERLGPELDRVIATLEPDQRTLLLLHDVDGWRQDEIAEILDIPLGTVKSRLHRVRAALRKKLQKELEPTASPGRVEN
ncbi:RNA polymerase sigma factor [Marinobacter sp. DUT-1]|uniref:RNA polymerase sigma factor n=1 Tax=Marinobacter sp. DUT-1 TaxID=3412037 RepID=UPI003D164B3B